MQKIERRYRTHDGFLATCARDTVVSLPAPPFEIEWPDRSETAPRLPPIRGELPKSEKRWLAHMARTR